MAELTVFIVNSLNTYYGIQATEIFLLPIGADINASIYKVKASNKKAYFVKLRRGHFHDVNIAILELLEKTGIKELIAPIKTVEGKKNQQAGDFNFIVYPFIEGQDGFSRNLTDEQWIVLGEALRRVHEIDLPLSLKSRIRRENFSSRWRDDVHALYAHIDEKIVYDEIAITHQKFLQKNRSIIERLVDRSSELSKKVRDKPVKYVLCHSDIHAGNILIDEKSAFYIVDWDDPILAPKERDLMFIGGGVGNVWNNADEEKLFYRGYGQCEIELSLLAYYRFERIVEDIAVCSDELLKNSKNPSRTEMYQQFIAMFAPRGVVDLAFETDKHLSCVSDNE